MQCGKLAAREVYREYSQKEQLQERCCRCSLLFSVASQAIDTRLSLTVQALLCNHRLHRPIVTELNADNHMQADPALTRRFQPVDVPEPSPEEALAVLMGLQPLYEQHHGVTFTSDALKSAVSCASQYCRNKLPDSAVDVMDEAAALCSSRVRMLCPSVPFRPAVPFEESTQCHFRALCSP